MPNYVKLTINQFKGSITEKVASHYLKKEGFRCEKFVNFTHLLWSIRYEQKKTKELSKLFLKRAHETMKKDKRFWKRDLEKYSSESPPKGWKDPRRRTWAEVRKGEIKMAQNQMKAVDRYYKENIEFERIWGTHFEHIIDYSRMLEEVNYIPDFIAKKGDKVFIVEVKSKTKGKVAKLGEHQKKGLLKAYDYGFTPMLLVVPIKTEIDVGEPYCLNLLTIRKSATS